MPFCPNCRAEYIEGVDTCPDCQVELVDELPPKEEPEYLDLVELEKVPDEVSGVMMKGILVNNGIFAILKSAKIPWYDGIGSTWSTYYWGIILVPKEDLEKSRRILNEYIESLGSEDIEDEVP